MMKLEGRCKDRLATRWKETESLNHFLEESCNLMSSTSPGLHVSMRNGIYFYFFFGHLLQERDELSK